MGYTRCWITTGNFYDAQTVKVIKKIIEIAKTDYNIKIKGYNGTGKPTVNTKQISLNGDKNNNLENETFFVENGVKTNFDFCKTARKPYDIVVNAIIQLLEEEDIIQNPRCGEGNNEKEAKELLQKAKKLTQNKLVLEAYDKDNDIYEALIEDYDIDYLKNIINIITNGKEPKMSQGEPVDWFLITNTHTGTPIEYFDMYEKTWKKYTTPKQSKPDLNMGKENL